MLAFGGLRINLRKNMAKTRCFYANMGFKTHLCDSNHRKRRQKSSTIPSHRINGASSIGKPIDVYLIVKRRRSMKITCDKTFSFTTSLVTAGANFTYSLSLILQSSLPPVRSVECGLFA
jgi:hypothetical protein